LMYRSNADELTVDAAFRIFRSLSNLTGYTIAVSGESFSRLNVRADGFMAWGSGAAGHDVNLYRAGVDSLKTDDTLTIGTTLQIRHNDGATALATPWMRSNGTNLVVNAATGGVLYLNHDVAGNVVMAQSKATVTTAGQFLLPTTGSGAGILFGGDTHLYRTVANHLGLFTNDILDLSEGGGTAASTGISVGDKISFYSNTYGIGIQSNRMVAWMSAGGGFAIRADNVVGQRSAGTDAVTLLASGKISATGLGKDTIALTNTAVDTGITIGGDTNIFRSAANVLRTDDYFQALQHSAISLGDFNTYGIGLWQGVVGAISIGASATDSYIQSWGGRELRINSQGEKTFIGSTLGTGLSIAGGLEVTSGSIIFPVGSLDGAALQDGTVPIGAFGFVFGGNNQLYNSGFEAAGTVDADPNATFQPWDGWTTPGGTPSIVAKPTTELRAGITLPVATIPIKTHANWTTSGTAHRGHHLHIYRHLSRRRWSSESHRSLGRHGHLRSQHPDLSGPHRQRRWTYARHLGQCIEAGRDHHRQLRLRRDEPESCCPRHRGAAVHRQYLHGWCAGAQRLCADQVARCS